MTHPSSFILHPSRSVRWVVAAGLAGCALLLGVAGWLYQRGPTPEPPEVPLDGVTPRVAEVIQGEVEAVRRQPRSGAAWGRLGKVLRAHGFDEQSVACWAQAERFDPSEPRWPYYRGVVLLMMGDNGGLDALRRAAALADQFDPENTCPRLTLAEQLLALSADGEAEEVLRVVQQKQPREARLLFCQAVLAERSGQAGKAARLFERLTRHPCARQRASARLAGLYARLGQASDAAEHGRRAAELPGDARWPDPYWEELSGVDVGPLAPFRELARRQDEQDVAAEYRQLMEMTEGEAGKSDKALLALALTQLRLGQRGQAEQSLRKALAAEPMSARVVYTLGLVLFLQAEEQQSASGKADAARLEEAVGLLRRAIELKPNDALAHLILGRALLAQGKRQQAVEALRVPVATRPEDFRSHFYLGIALTEDGQLAEARKCLERAAQLAGPDNPEPARALERLREKEKGGDRRR